MSHEDSLGEKTITKDAGYASDRSPSLKDKRDSNSDPLGVLNTIRDPDEGLSEEERHRLVGYEHDCYGTAR